MITTPEKLYKAYTKKICCICTQTDECDIHVFMQKGVLCVKCTNYKKGGNGNGKKRGKPCVSSR